MIIPRTGALGRRVLSLVAASLLAGPAWAGSLDAPTPGAAAPHWAATDVTVAIATDAASGHVSPTEVEAAARQAAAAWNALAHGGPRLQVGAGAVAVEVRFLSSWGAGARTLGRTVLTTDRTTGVVARATVEINEEHFRFTARDVAMILIHEFGHVLGLGHSDDRQSVMFPFDDLGEALVRGPAAVDVGALVARYGAARKPTVLVDPASFRKAKTEGVTDLTACTRQMLDGHYVVGPCEVDSSLALEVAREPRPHRSHRPHRHHRRH